MKDLDDIPALMDDIGTRARAASRVLAHASAERKHAALIGAAEAVWKRRDEIIAANVRDMDYGRDKGLSPAMMDRLTPRRGSDPGHRRRAAHRCRTA